MVRQAPATGAATDRAPPMDPPAPPAAPRTGARLGRLGPLLLAALVLALCLGLTAQLWRAARRDAGAALRADFDFRARELVNSLAQRMATYTQVLRGVQGLFASSQQVTRAEFDNYMREQALQAQFPGVLGIGYMALVEADARASHIAQVRREGYPNYTIAPPGERARYAPVLYLAPFSGANLRAFGWDGWSEPLRRSMLEQARDSGQAAMSGKLALVQDRGAAPAPAFLVALPVYRNGMPHASLAERGKAIRGWVFAPFRMDELVAGLGGERGAELAVEFYDGDTVTRERRLAARGEDGARAALALTTEQRISIAGHRWTLAIGALPAFEAQLQTEQARAILFGGLTASALMTLLTWLLARSSAQARAALGRARALTDELERGQQRLAGVADGAQRAQALLRSVLDSTIDGVLVDDGARTVLLSNPRFRELWSVPQRLEVLGEDRLLLEHLQAQLVHPAPFLYSRAPQPQAAQEQRELLRLKDGRFIEQFTRTVRLNAGQARLWSFRDITERKQIEQRERSHRHVLELLARGAPLHAILEAVVLGIEATNPGMLCAILLQEGEGEWARLVTGAAPSLPHEFNQAMHGVRVAYGAGSCGTAAFSGSRVIVEQIDGHPFWDGWHALAARAGLASCWSEPVRGASGKVLGSFAIYHRQAHYPSPANVVLIEQAAQLAGIAIEQARAAQALRIGEERFRSLYDHAPVALWEQDWSALRAAVSVLEANGVGELAAYLASRPAEVRRLAALVRVTDVNAAALAQVGAADKELSLLGLAQVFADAAQPSFIAALAALAGGALHFGCEGSFVRLDGVLRQNEVTMLVMPGHDQSLDFVIVSTLDITERKRMNAELTLLATTDFLTGLPNRREFMARLDEELARLQRNLDDSAAVLMLDIDHFKSVNDLYGHAAGDAVLRHMAALMRANQRKVDTLGRMGGEEFAVLLPAAGPQAAQAYAERLRHSVERSLLTLDGHQVGITVSIGIARVLPGDASADAALIRADQALYSAKQAGRNRVGAPQAA
ncbi:MAG: CHASE domain-containing protein [Pseudomonadota bacterium]